MLTLSQEQNQHLLELREDIRRKQELERDIERDAHHLRELQSSCRVLEDQLKEKEENVRRQKKDGFAAFVANLLYHSREETEKNQQELREMQFRFRQTQEDYAKAENDLKLAREEWQQFRNAEEDYEELYAQKRIGLLERGDALSGELRELMDHQCAVAIQHQEVLEAYLAANGLLKVVKALQATLTFWQRQKEAGFFSGNHSMQNQYLEQIHEACHQVKAGFAHLHREMEDIGEENRPEGVMEQVLRMESAHREEKAFHRLNREETETLRREIESVEQELFHVTSQLFGRKERMGHVLEELNRKIDRIVLGDLQ